MVSSTILSYSIHHKDNASYSFCKTFCYLKIAYAGEADDTVDYNHDDLRVAYPRWVVD